MIGIYEIRNVVNGKVYIGQSVHVETRWNQHKRELRRGCHRNAYLQAAWDKSPKDFVFNVLCECSEAELNDLEKYYIDVYCSADYRYGYNLQGGGDSLHHQSEITKQKISEKNGGKIYSDELKAYYSKAHDFEKIKVVCVETQESFLGLKQLEKLYGFAPSGITHCCQTTYAIVHDIDFPKVYQLRAYGFHWAYEDDFEQYAGLYFDIVNNDVRNSELSVYCVNTKVIYDNVMACATDLKLSIRNVYACCNGHQKSTKGVYLCYHDDYLHNKAYYEMLLDCHAKLTKRPIICIETGEVFESGKAAADAFGVARSTVIAVCSENNRKKSCKGHHFAYKDLYDENPEKYLALINQPAIVYKIRRVICMETGVIFENATAAAKFAGGSKQNILAACRRGWLSGGYHWKLLDDDKGV